ncbi:hypothetical protein PB2503_00902 [Parvularcula bermudensis HTCC2503]|uniref:Uncharacterized protein n=1 Tax=Parvularcula bermudensis (strain ATCC BAA-594 / HTCC2503 / KCTC 12087) TaxID=314260 RepID=E0TB57_PARBH|nr:hypothetical protein [Parvularcula bermudensis]ADM08261.1 hypothetical protein PB2503_00902 [Parvularcula bermudensis HTCC2503]
MGVSHLIVGVTALFGAATQSSDLGSVCTVETARQEGFLAGSFARHPVDARELFLSKCRFPRLFSTSRPSTDGRLGPAFLDGWQAGFFTACEPMGLLEAGSASLGETEESVTPALCKEMAAATVKVYDDRLTALDGQIDALTQALEGEDDAFRRGDLRDEITRLQAQRGAEEGARRQLVALVASDSYNRQVYAVGTTYATAKAAKERASAAIADAEAALALNEQRLNGLFSQLRQTRDADRRAALLQEAERLEDRSALLRSSMSALRREERDSEQAFQIARRDYLKTKTALAESRP